MQDTKNLLISLCMLGSALFPFEAFAGYHFADFRASTPIHIHATTGKVPKGITPTEIKSLYHLPTSGGEGTIAIIAAYHDTTIESDLALFDSTFNIKDCTVKNSCLTIHRMNSKTRTDSNWNLETTLDVEWAHAIAPHAHILLIEAATPSGANLLKAVDYAASLPDVRAVSMSWGGAEFSEEVTLDEHFKSVSGAVFFASSGDNGTGASWPAASPNVVAVGGTTLLFDTAHALKGEEGWVGSGGGVSAYETEPSYQQTYGIKKSGGMRAIPDVAYNADPKSGFPIVHKGVWRTVGGTSAGAPQWAAIATLGSGAENSSFYKDKSGTNTTGFFRDITSGANGDCAYYCTARTHYDYITGLGTPLTVNF